jgi:hypothetical protein
LVRGIVHQYLNRTKFALNPLYRDLGEMRVAKVTSDAKHSMPLRLHGPDEFAQRFGGPGNRSHLGPGACQFKGSSSADTATASGNNGHTTFQLS